MNPTRYPGKWVEEREFLTPGNGNGQAPENEDDAQFLGNAGNPTGSRQVAKGPGTHQYYYPPTDQRTFIENRLSRPNTPLPAYCSSLMSLTLSSGDEQVQSSQADRFPSREQPSWAYPRDNVEHQSNSGFSMSGQRSVKGVSPPAASDLESRITRINPSSDSGAELPCHWCSTVNPTTHLMFCPLKGSNKIKINSKAAMPPPRLPPPHPIDEGSRAKYPTPALSIECQKRGFNPEFKYRGPDEDGNFKADLYLRGVLISGNNIRYPSEKAARDALASRGLEKLREMRLRPTTSASLGPKDSDKAAMPSSRAVRPTQGFAFGNVKSRSDQREIKPRVGVADAEPMEIDLPGNIPASAVDSVLNRAFKSAAVITINLPANVSAEVAQAYGRGLSTLNQTSRANESSNPPQRRFRSRSASPIRKRDNARLTNDFRNRDYNRWGSSSYRPGENSRRLRAEARGHISAPSARRLTPPPGLRRGRPSGELLPHDGVKDSKLRLLSPSKPYLTKVSFGADSQGNNTSPYQPRR